MKISKDQEIDLDKKQKNVKYLVKIMAIILTAAAFAAAVIFLIWHQGGFLPKWIVWQEKTLDLPDDHEAPDSIVLEHRHIKVFEDENVVWESPEHVLVQDFLWCDIDHDNVGELMLLCWRIGRYGDAKPFWIKEDEYVWSQHIYIYDWHQNEIHAAWMASDIGMEVLEWRFDISERIVITETSGRKTGWDWVSWGLSLIRTYAENP